MAADFKLGPALVDAAGSTAHIPGPWRKALLRDFLDSPARSSVALTCKSALQLLLSECSTAQLTVPVRCAARRAQLLKRLRVAKEQLALRRGLRTTLWLQQRGRIDQEDAWWETVLPALGQGGRRSLRLCTQADSANHRRLPRSTSVQMVLCCPPVNLAV